VFGTVTLERAGYGLKGTESLHPLDAELNLPDERYSLELRRRMLITTYSWQDFKVVFCLIGKYFQEDLTKGFFSLVQFSS
jgi:hypothetical protein